MKVISPLSGSNNVKHEKDIDTSFIINMYWEKLKIDVSSYFKFIDKVSILIDQDTGYRFYYPFNISGDNIFYGELQKNEWYYMPWKWEHKKCEEFIRSGDKVLEIGCATGDFLIQVKKNKNIQEVGLELNESAAEEGRNKGVNIRCELIEDHARRFSNTYDVICCFQVLEHISKVNSFIKASIDCLKPGGRIIFCVPNNNSFPKHDWENDILNMPPHHMGLWNEKVFKGLSTLFKVKKVKILFEPLQVYHHRFYISVLEKRIFKSKILKKLYLFFRFQAIVRLILKVFSNKIIGHSIMAVYSK